MLLKLLLFAQLGFAVNQIHFPLQLGIPGVAPVNLIFVFVLLAMRGKPELLTLEPPALQKPLLRFYAALVFAFLIAQVTAPGELIVDLTYLKTALFYPLYYFIYLKCRQDEKTTRQLIIWIMVIAAVAGLEAIREGLDYGFGAYGPTRRASGPFGVNYQEANRAGVFYAMYAPMFVALALFLRGQVMWRVAALAGTASVVGGSLFTYSRQSYILVLLSVALLLLRKSIIVAVVVAVAAVSLSGYLPDSVFERVEETRQSHTRSGEQEVDVSTASRWEIWEGALGMWQDHPLGVGLNRFKWNIGNYSSHRGMDAHNFYVLTLAETGPQGLITYLLFLWSLFRLAKIVRQRAAPDPETIALSLGFTIATVCVALGQLFGSPIFEGSVMSTYWALCGLLERYVQLNLSRSARREPPQPRSLADRFPLAAHLPSGRAGRG